MTWVSSKYSFSSLRMSWASEFEQSTFFSIGHCFRRNTNDLICLLQVAYVSMQHPGSSMQQGPPVHLEQHKLHQMHFPKVISMSTRSFFYLLRKGSLNSYPTHSFPLHQHRKAYLRSRSRSWRIPCSYLFWKDQGEIRKSWWARTCLSSLRFLGTGPGAVASLMW